MNHDHRRACLRCGGETKVSQVAPFEGGCHLEVVFSTCTECGYTVGNVRKEKVPVTSYSYGASRRAQDAADEADRRHERRYGIGRATCDPSC